MNWRPFYIHNSILMRIKTHMKQRLLKDSHISKKQKNTFVLYNLILQSKLVARKRCEKSKAPAATWKWMANTGDFPSAVIVYKMYINI